MDGAHDVGRVDLAASDANEDVVDRCSGEARQRCLEPRFGEFLAGALEGALDDLSPEAAELRFRRLARGAADCRARPARHDDAVPGGERRAPLEAGDLHLVAIVQNRDQRRDPPVDLASDRRIADVGVHRIGEIDGGRPARQRDQASLRGEAEHLVMEELELGVLEKFL